MRYAKKIGFATVVAVALTALLSVGSASATVLCKKDIRPCPTTQDWEFGETFEAALIAGTSTTLKDTSGFSLNTCTSGTLKGKTENTGAKGVSVKIEPTSWTFNNCNRTAKTLNLGQMTLQYIPEPNNTVGTLIAKEVKIEVQTAFGKCVFGTGAELSMGLVTGRRTEPGNETAAMIHMTPVLAPVEGFCPASAALLAAYHISEPAPLYIKEETA
jgi:hypothetical protein